MKISLLARAFLLTFLSFNAQALEIHHGKLLSSKIEKSAGAVGGYIPGKHTEYVLTLQALSSRNIFNNSSNNVAREKCVLCISHGAFMAY